MGFKCASPSTIAVQRRSVLGDLVVLKLSWSGLARVRGTEESCDMYTRFSLAHLVIRRTLTLIVALGFFLPRFYGERPNIVFIFTDDHATQAISAYGGMLADIAPTPNLDRIANEGILFRKCYVTNSICGPVRAVIQTGKHSHLNGFRQNGDRFDGSQPTAPKYLRKAGYQTAIIGKWHANICKLLGIE